MPNVTIIKLKIRRGTDAQRKQVILDQGELGFTTDTNRLFVGTGLLSGGIAASNKFLGHFSTSASLIATNAQPGDMAYAGNILYTLTAVDYTNLDNWSAIHPQFDTTYLTYDANNVLTITDESIDAAKLNPNIAYNGIVVDNVNGISVDIDTSFFEFDGSKLSLKGDSISQDNIKSSSFGGGISGGDGDLIGLDVDTSVFTLTSGKLELYSWPVSAVGFNSLREEAFGAGLVYNESEQVLETEIASVDNGTIINTNGEISLSDIHLVGTSDTWSTHTVDIYGRVINFTPTIVDYLTGGTTIQGSVSHIGYPAQVTEGFTSLPESYSIIQCISAVYDPDDPEIIQSTGTVNLSSAGFIVFNGASVGTGLITDRFAIPVYSF
jgi:hypothetical protein